MLEVGFLNTRNEIDVQIYLFNIAAIRQLTYCNGRFLVMGASSNGSELFKTHDGQPQFLIGIRDFGMPIYRNSPTAQIFARLNLRRSGFPK